MNKITIEEYNPVDGKFFLINQNGGILAKAYTKNDAQLIAAAPELLEALKSMIDLWSPYLHCVGEIGKEKMIAAQKAINKAEGR